MDCGPVTISFYDNTVSGILLYPTTEITAAQMLEKYGSPDHMMVFISSILPDEPTRSSVRLFYDRFQAFIDLVDENGKEFIIDEETAISSINYNTEAVYQEYQDVVAHYLTPWEGYGTFSAH
jgi:hypothetical protein